MSSRPKDPEAELSTALRPGNRSLIVTAPVFTLRAVGGPDEGKTFRIDASQATSRVLVGKGPASDFCLADPEVSRRHAAFSLAGDALLVTDLDSTNGTFVGPTRVVAAYLHGGEELRMGGTALRVELTEVDKAVPLSPLTRFGNVIGSSVEMRRLYPLCERLAGSDVPVVIEGETGTGKEVLAEAIHAASARAQGPFVVFDCTAVPGNLLEAELFGYERGAFTGAAATHRGIFEQAHGGTLLIDEIGDLDLALQPKLLRAIQRSEIRRLGGDRWIPVDVRVLAATRRDLDRAVADGRFRDDLFFRLAVARIELPPLRRRQGDVSTLAAHFWTELGGSGALPYELLQSCEHYDWPGNVRELCNEITRRIALGDLAPEPPARTGARTTASEAPGRASQPPPVRHADDADFMDRVLAEDLPLPRARQRVVDEFQHRYVERVVTKHGGSIVRAAQASGIAYRYFQLLRARQAKR